MTATSAAALPASDEVRPAPRRWGAPLWVGALLIVLAFLVLYPLLMLVFVGGLWRLGRGGRGGRGREARRGALRCATLNYCAKRIRLQDLHWIRRLAFWTAKMSLRVRRSMQPEQ